jgi:hypothetical protein
MGAIRRTPVASPALNYANLDGPNNGEMTNALDTYFERLLTERLAMDRTDPRMMLRTGG